MPPKKRSYKELIGKRFNKLILIRFVRMDSEKRQIWLTLCDCGASKNIRLSAVKAGVTLSCGCYGKSMARIRGFTHRLSRSRFYRIWKGIRERCTRKTFRDYHNYGGRGIEVE